MLQTRRRHARSMLPALTLVAICLATLACSLQRLAGPVSATPHFTATPPAEQNSTPTHTPPSASPSPQAPPIAGKIVFTCQLFSEALQDQICLMAPDGSGWRRLTSRDGADHFYPSLAPDGGSVLFSSNMKGGYDIYEMHIASGAVTRLTSLGEAYAPAVAPDNSAIVFTHIVEGVPSIWRMNRDGSSPQLLIPSGWDATWSPDSSRILHASDRGGSIQLWIGQSEGGGLNQVTDLPDLRGRSDWSADGQWMATYSGVSWEREILRFDVEGNNAEQLTNGGNNLAPSFSPDGEWVAYNRMRTDTWMKTAARST